MKTSDSLLNLLAQNNPQTASELAEQLEISTRTVYRWIDQLIDKGIPITCTKGRSGGIFLSDKYVKKSDIDVNFDWLEIDFSEQDKENKIDQKYAICRDSILSCHILNFVYVLSESKKLNCSTEPVKMFLHDNQWHVLAWIRQVEKYKLFKIENMNNLVDTEKTFSRKADFSIHEMLNKQK